MNGRSLLAWNIRRLRAERGVSQERLAADTGVDRAYVSELEREQGNATVDLLDRLAEAFQTHISEFFIEPPPGVTRPAVLQKGRKSKA
jgi:transcriptional regulator with XRE-family HTH domain